ncbi:FUSC family protein [Streptomyces sp. AP-93]|uniref:FUSC family protein n=1 Tax=Streptomyces sp. AP-93 TaxID=2929048 RepID=UPI001FAE9980|nr:FUSC family protein [Streptomyces sp. AP-93]MCJ0872552.1 FUSC family protein [Streptomyces sp. AP-93]
MSARDFAGGLTDLFLAREENGRYSWQLALVTMAGMLVPMLIGIATDRVEHGTTVALSSVLLGLALPSGSTTERMAALAQRSLMITAAAALGILVAGQLTATTLAIAVVALLVPVRAIGASALVTLVITAEPAGRIDGAEHIALFALGTVWGSLLALLPFISGPPPDGPRPAPLSVRQSWTALRSAISGRTPPFRYAVRLAVCFILTFVAVTAADLPHGTWALIGIVTTMRPSWGQTARRVVKRMGGTILGSAIGAALLAMSGAIPPVPLAVITAVLAGIARPLRQVNYGLWPIFWAPATLLLLTFGSHPSWIDAAERVGNNALGAALAVAATLILWPHNEETDVPGRLALLLSTQARWLDRVASAIGHPPTERLHTIQAVEAAEAELTASRGRLAIQPHPSRDVLTELDATSTAAGRLRGLVHAHFPYDAPHLPFTPGELRVIAGKLRGTADRVDGIDDTTQRPMNGRGEITAAAADLIEHAAAAAAACLRPAQRAPH